jgi:beta-1,4-mannosyltransferase
MTVGLSLRTEMVGFISVLMNVVSLIHKMLILRLVTRGDNIEAVRRTVYYIQRTYRQRVEIVTDRRLDIEADQIVVPRKYAPKNGAKWKARALHYAAVNHTNPDDWYLHLDEESVPSMACIAGCLKFIYKNPQGAIGQGEILYTGHGYKEHRRVCAADSLRTGDDMLRFRAQYAMGKPLFGVHGSFLLIKGSIEKELGWDLGAGGSVTEDASFAIKAWQKGIKFGWVEGEVIEQSPYCFMDFIRQRRRWFNGLWVVVLCKELELKYRIILGVMMVYWALSPFILLMNFFILFGLQINVWIKAFFVISFLYYLLAYSIGGYRNGGFKGMIFSILFLPISFFYESVGVLYGIVRPVKTFEVVNKN